MKWMGKMAGLPEDAIGRIPRVVVIGMNKVAVYNAEKLEQFTDRTVRIQLSDAVLEIQGKSLEVLELMPSEVVIEGTMTSVCLKEKRFG
ncbi:YabP/YqfC family sporulation protein [Domibacillus sp. 8LH]|uniref:YabP/YqfC family sporulation protein n=1 Tax=Domibacillus TaxID=1433999 RepID=UPI0020425253|nr:MULTISPECIES: YabP/YqfC family sporulation protein [Domibacillus]MCM3788468.1 YabP/YqfC family sporulation protein [Domibacillus indicus]WNS81921.1 YabP/YqfC family sporulation protein [Domibacillus sp. DTU_2020_1001157_1_SI_ALB_TIR_016]